MLHGIINEQENCLDARDDISERNECFSQILFSCPLGSWVSLWNFETIRGLLMKPTWQKLASLAMEICIL